MTSSRRTGRDAASPRPAVPRWDLCLYVAGRTPMALHALANLTSLCEAHLAGRYAIEVVDVRENPAAAVDGQVLALPAVVRRAPPPERRVIGDLSNVARVLRALAIADAR